MYTRFLLNGTSFKDKKKTGKKHTLQNFILQTNRSLRNQVIIVLPAVEEGIRPIAASSLRLWCDSGSSLLINSITT